MISRLTIILMIFTSLKVKSQTSEQIGKSVFEAFRFDQKGLTEYLEDSTAIEFQMIETLKEKNNDFKNLFGKDTSIFTYIQIEQLSIGFAKMFDSLYKKGMKDEWQKIIQSKHTCNLSSNSFQLIKETNNDLPALKPNEKVYLLKLNVKNAAIRFYTVLIENKIYLEKLSGIYYPNEKGKYCCTSTCKDGKEIYGGCIELEEKTKSY